MKENGEVHVDLRQLKVVLQSENFQFLNKKLENRRVGFLNFVENLFRVRSVRTLKSFCRSTIKMEMKFYPENVERLSIGRQLNERLRSFLTFDNKFAFDSFV